MLLSIIIPVYNAELYISDCINSIYSSQDVLPPHETIIIDDGSTDNSLNILKKIAVENDYIKLIEQENKGVSQTRNLGLQMASGTYIILLDADDMINGKLLFQLTKYLERNEVSLGLYGFKVVPENYNYLNFISERELILNQSEIKFYEDGYEQIASNWFQGESWQMIFHKKIIIDNSLFFPNVVSSEDINFTLSTILNARKVLRYSGILYFYRHHSSSAVRNRNKLHLLKANEGMLVAIKSMISTINNLQKTNIHYTLTKQKIENSLNQLIFNLMQRVVRFSLPYKVLSANIEILKKYNCYPISEFPVSSNSKMLRLIMLIINNEKLLKLSYWLLRVKNLT